MKKTILLSLALIWSMAMLAQDVVSDSIRRDLNGNISFIKFPRAANTRSSVKVSKFFEQILRIPKGKQFVKVKSQSRPNGMVHETYEQNYQGLQIEDAVYILHYKEGILTSANGHYVPIENLNVVPKIKKEDAWKV